MIRKMKVKKEEKEYQIYIDMESIEDDEPNMVYYDDQGTKLHNLEFIDDDFLFNQWVVDLDVGKSVERKEYTLTCICEYENNCFNLW